jgi:putative ABC transport system substrate-binding protein
LISRRAFVVAATGGLLAAPRAAGAQAAGKVHRVGFLGNSTETLEANLVGPLREGFRELGYVDGRDLVIEYRWAEGRYERFPALIAELIALKVDVIVTAGTPAALAVRRATTAIPLVMVAVGDPVGSGLVKSLARPGGNLTGLVSIAPDLEGKRLELLTEVVPKLSYVAFLLNPANAFHVTSEKQARAAAKALHLKVKFFPVREDAEFDRAFQAISSQRPGALIMLADRLFLHHRARIVDF